MKEVAISIVRASLRDLRAIVAMEEECFADPWPEQSLVTELKADDMRVPLVARRGLDTIGYLMAWKIVDQLHVLNLAVRSNFRRQGIATMLLAEATAIARRRGCCELTLEVRRSNEGALAFYRRHGFDVVGCRPRYYHDNGEDALIMTRRLPGSGEGEETG